MQHDAFPNPLGRVDAAAHQGLDPLTWHESLQMKVMQNVALAVCKTEPYSMDQRRGGAIWVGHGLNGLVGGLAASRRLGL